MSTVVMVERGREICMAAESLRSFGSRKQSAHYVERPEKILQVGGTYFGIVGWSVTQTVLQSALSHELELPEFRNELELFEFSRVLHQKLKDEYFLNSAAEDGEPFESSHLTMFVMNRHGLYALYSLRTVERCRRFAAIGSGADYALGAMYAAYEQGLAAEEVARLGVEAGIEFDGYSQGPISIKRMKLES